MANVGTLTAKLVAHTGKFTAGMKRAGKTVRGFSAKVAAVGKVVRNFSLGMAAVGTGAAIGFSLMVRKQMAVLDATAKLSAQLGVTTKDLMKLRHAAELTGAGAKSLDAGLATMAKRLGEAARGSGAAAPALKELGLEAKALVAMSPDQAFREIAGALEKIEQPAKRNAIAANLFSKANMGLLNTLALGKKGLADTGKEAERLGATFSNIDLAGIEAANDSIFKMKTAFGGLAQQAAIGLGPIVSLLADDLTNALVDAKGAVASTKTEFGVMAGAVMASGDAIQDFAKTMVATKIAFAKIMPFVTGATLGDSYANLDEAVKHWQDTLIALEDKPKWSKGIAERLRALRKELEETAKEAEKAGGKMGEAMAPPVIDQPLDNAIDKVAEFGKTWQKQIDTFGMSGREKGIKELMDAGKLDPYQLKELEALDAKLTGLENPADKTGGDKNPADTQTASTFTPAAAMGQYGQAAYSTIVKAMNGTRNPQVDLLKTGNKQRQKLIDQGVDKAEEPPTVVIGP